MLQTLTHLLAFLLVKTGEMNMLVCKTDKCWSLTAANVHQQERPWTHHWYWLIRAPCRLLGLQTAASSSQITTAIVSAAAPEIAKALSCCVLSGTDEGKEAGYQLLISSLLLPAAVARTTVAAAVDPSSVLLQQSDEKWNLGRRERSEAPVHEKQTSIDFKWKQKETNLSVWIKLALKKCDFFSVFSWMF